MNKQQARLVFHFLLLGCIVAELRAFDDFPTGWFLATMALIAAHGIRLGFRAEESGRSP
jgi:hypothetical protein